jgi:hypothetical protein
MITNTGKTIISKFLLGQAPSFASHIAVGCGKKPILLTDPQPDFSSKTSLDFEMFRIPISSRGYVSENNINKLVLTAELPTEERYEITEVGIFSAGSNPSAGQSDSKTVFGFTDTENWQYNNGSSSSDIPKITEQLDSTSTDTISTIDKINVNTNTNITEELYVFETNADNAVFFNQDRVDRYERARFFNNVILMRGDSSVLPYSGSHFTSLGGKSVVYPNSITSFSQNSPIDELRLALSIITKNSSSDVPDKVNVVVNFTNSDGSQYARFEAVLNNGTNPGQYDFTTNRYFVISKQLQELATSSGFNWDIVTQVQIYANAIDNGSASSNYYIALDALRLENIATINPLYGLTGYSIVQNSDATTIVKSPNTNNYIEFRFAVGVA